MDCHQIQNLLSEYLDGELPAEPARAVEVHTRSCPDCGKALADLRAAISELHNLPALSAPQSLSSSVMSRVRDGAPGAAAPPRRRITRVGASLLAAAAGLLLVFSGFLLTRSGGRPSPQIASTLHEDETALDRMPEPEAARPVRKMEQAFIAPEEPEAVAAKIAPVQPAPAATKAADLFKAEGKRVPALALKRGTKLAVVEEALEQTLALGKKMPEGAGAAQAPKRKARREMARAQGQAVPPRPTARPATPAIAVQSKPRRPSGAGPPQKVELRTMTEAEDALEREPTAAHRTITVVTNDPDKAAADIAKRVRRARAASQRGRSDAVSRPITVVMTQPEYVALLTDLTKAGYTLERQLALRSKTQTEAAVYSLRQAKEAEHRLLAVRVTIRFRRTVAEPAAAREAQEKHAP